MKLEYWWWEKEKGEKGEKQKQKKMLETNLSDIVSYYISTFY